MAHISLDGIVQPQSDRNDDKYREYANGLWTVPFRSQEGAAAVLEAQGANFDLLLGRRTYDLWAGFWPHVKNNPMGDAINAATKYIATHRPESLVWGPVKHLGADLAQSVRKLKSENGPDLVAWGTSAITNMLLTEGLADEVVLIVYPVLLGRGKHFSDGVDPRLLALVSSKATPSGGFINTYSHVRPLQGPPV